MKLAFALAAFMALSIPLYGRQYQQGKILYWTILSHGSHDTESTVIYRLEVGDGVSQIVQDTKHPEAHLAVGQQIQFRIDKNRLFMFGERGKEVRFSILEPALVQPICPSLQPAHFELICASSPLLS